MTTITIDMSDEQINALDDVANVYAMDRSAVICRLVEDRHKSLTTTKSENGRNDFHWEAHHDEIVEIVMKRPDPVATSHIAEEMPEWYDASFWRTLFPRALNQLVRNGYLVRYKSGYALTEKGRRRAAMYGR